MTVDVAHLLDFFMMMLLVDILLAVLLAFSGRSRPSNHFQLGALLGGGIAIALCMLALVLVGGPK